VARAIGICLGPGLEGAGGTLVRQRGCHRVLAALHPIGGLVHVRRLWLKRFARHGPVHGGDGGFSGGTDHGNKGRRSSGMEMASPLLNESHSRYGRPDCLGPLC
jgi:hypothetical protein